MKYLIPALLALAGGYFLGRNYDIQDLLDKCKPQDKAEEHEQQVEGALDLTEPQKQLD